MAMRFIAEFAVYCQDRVFRARAGYLVKRSKANKPI